VLLVAAAAAVCGCSSLPQDGPVQQGSRPDGAPEGVPFEFNPQGPRPGAGPSEIVSGFLSALQATPVGTSVASQFLTREAADDWRPERGTIIYGSQRLEPRKRWVRVRLTDTAELDRTGRWLGAREEATRSLDLRVAREDGEWRVADPPDAMVVPDSHFVSRYRQYSLYFLDATRSVLVPEPVFLPFGAQAPTQLVAGLLAGPPGRPRSSLGSAFPDGTRLTVSVPVSPDGVAEVPLDERALTLSEDQLEASLAQLAWTLRQVPDVERLRVLVDGNPLDIPGGDTVSVSGWSGYSPAVSAASTDIFGIRGRLVREIVVDSEITALDIADTVELYGRPHSLGVSMTAQRFALVAADRARAVVLDRSTDGARRLLVHPGTDFLRPMWDLTDRLWLVDRTDTGAVVSVSHDAAGQRTARPVTVPGVTGSEVVAAALSRDGTRLAVLRRMGDREQLVLSRVLRDGRGRPVRVTPARLLPTGEGIERAVSLGWRDPTTVAVLTTASPSASEVVLVRCDGSSGYVPPVSSIEAVPDRGRSVVASPGGPTALLISARGARLHAIDAQGRWDLDVVEPGLRAPTFVG